MRVFWRKPGMTPQSSVNFVEASPTRVSRTAAKLRLRLRCAMCFGAVSVESVFTLGTRSYL